MRRAEAEEKVPLKKLDHENSDTVIQEADEQLERINIEIAKTEALIKDRANKVQSKSLEKD